MNARRISRPSSVRIGMFCRFGSVLDSRPVAATVCWIGGVDAAVVADRLAQPLDGRLEPGDVPVPQQVGEERVPGLLVQADQRVGVGGVPGLGALGLGHVQLVEQHHLQLLGRAEVDLPADLGVSRPWRRSPPRRRRWTADRRDSRCRRRCRRVPSSPSTVITGSSMSASSDFWPSESRCSSSASGQVDDRPGLHHVPGVLLAWLFSPVSSPRDQRELLPALMLCSGSRVRCR